jgi:uncharacterized protein (UPF0218 family)
MGTDPKHILALKSELRQELKNPLGLLLKGTPEDTMKQLSLIIEREQPEIIVAVGDVVSRNMLKAGIRPHIIIIDGKVMREPKKTFNTQDRKRITLENPAGTIVPQAWMTVEEALSQGKPVVMIVDGEEDLLTLVAVSKAPKGSLVVYGQPNEGVVAVNVNDTAKHKVNLIIRAMEPLPKS